MAGKVTFISRGSFITEDENGRRLPIEKGTHSVPASVWERIKATLPIAVASQQLVEVKLEPKATTDTVEPEGDATEGGSSEGGGDDPVASPPAATEKPKRTTKPKAEKPAKA